MDNATFLTPGDVYCSRPEECVDDTDILSVLYDKIVRGGDEHVVVARSKLVLIEDLSFMMPSDEAVNDLVDTLGEFGWVAVVDYEDVGLERRITRVALQEKLV